MNLSRIDTPTKHQLTTRLNHKVLFARMLALTQGLATRLNHILLFARGFSVDKLIHSLLTTVS